MDTLTHAIRFDHHLDAARPFNVRCTQYRQPTPAFSADSHYDLQIGVVLRGCEEIAYANHRLSAGPGQVWLTSCWEPHATRLTKPSKRIVITISPEFIGHAAPFGEVDWLAPFFAPPAERPRVGSPALARPVIRIGEMIFQTARTKPPARGQCSLLWLKIHELLLLLIANWHRPPGRPETAPRLQNLQRIVPALKRLKSQPAARYRLSEAARDCRLSPSRFRCVFSRTMGLNFRQFALQARISRAAWLLRSTGEPIKRIGLDCGFANLQHFYHVFTNHFHCAPSQYRDQAMVSARR